MKFKDAQFVLDNEIECSFILVLMKLLKCQELYTLYTIQFYIVLELKFKSLMISNFILELL